MSNRTDADTKHCAAYAIQGIMYSTDEQIQATVLDLLARSDSRARDITESLVSSQEQKLTIESIIPTGYVEEIWRENWICGLALEMSSFAMQTHVQNQHTNQLLRSIFHILSRDAHFGKFMLPSLVFLSSVEHAGRFAHRFNEAMSRADERGDMCSVVDAICFTCVSVRQSQMASCNLTLTAKLSDKNSLASFMHSIDKPLLVSQFLRTDAYTDALIELEMHLMSSSAAAAANFPFHQTSFETLQEVYWRIGDCDNVVGVLNHYLKSIKSLPSLQLVALANEAQGNSVDTVSCYERVIGEEGDSSTRLKLCRRYLRSLIAVDQLYTASSLADRTQQSFKGDAFVGFQIETAWRLCDWTHLRELCGDTRSKPETPLLSHSVVDLFELNVGRILNAFLSRSPTESIVSKSIVNQCDLLSEYISCANSTRSAKCLIKLQLINEIERDFADKSPSVPAFRLLADLPDIGSVNLWVSVKKSLASALLARDRIALPDAFYSDLLVGQSRACRMISSQHGAGTMNTWLCSSMRSALSAAASRVSEDPLRLANIFLEQAHWYGGQSRAFQAISELERAASFAERTADVRIRAVIDLLHAKWLMDSALADSGSLVAAMRDSCRACERWAVLKAEAHFSLAYLLDYVLGTAHDKNSGEHFVEMCAAYVATVDCLSTQRAPGGRVQQCLSRLFTHYFMLGKDSGGGGGGGAGQLAQVSDLIGGLVRDQRVGVLNALMVIFNQLVSRICHPSRLVFQTLNDILCALLETFPDRAVWYMVSGSQSTNAERRQRCQQLLTRASRLSSVAATAIRDCLDVCSLLSDLCQRKPKLATGPCPMSFKRHFPKILARVQTCQLILPIKRQLLADVSSFVHFAGFEDGIDVMKSLQRPKRVVARGSDGLNYSFLCKARDDLRIDQRMMEVCQLINRCFLQRHDSVADDDRPATVSKKNDLYIRTYSVLPITDACGLIEMVPGLSTVRSVLEGLYEKYNGLVVARVAVRQLAAPDPRVGDPAASRLESFTTRLLPTFSPPVLHHWFASDQFESSAAPVARRWYAAKMNFCRTAAVMSMVGWMVGLGDRHCENILLDTNNGDCVHVDFNCLFNKGETFQVPELVPFRLTHNIVHAMGALGVEGTFRRTCEKVTLLMRTHKDVLVSVLETFVYDPLVEWKRSSTRQTKGIDAPTDTETLNPMAKSQIDNIRWRLSGHVGKLHNEGAKSAPLSVDGQVDLLIRQAMDKLMLAQMFVGWAPYM